ncbi:MAG: DNA primase [Oscillospiraceae bacterium]|nr:DNA primase [Oscillospiraceae bacterium]
MAQFSDSFLQELADRNDIVDVVGSYVRLNKKSGANLFGLCPFHSEKTPSFSVNAEKQIFHCFGCGKGGGVIGFIMEIENLSFPDAVEFLARRAGMEVPQDPDEQAGRLKRDRLLALNKAAARYYHNALKAAYGQPGRDYVNRRKISPAFVVRFGLGFAPDDFYALTDAMRQQGYQDYELIEAGLANANRSGKGVHDVFRNRLMFPVIDVRGNVIGFSGRTLGDDDRKYLNTRDTPVFNKSRNLFALNLAKKSKSGYILLVEGNIDVVSLHQAGFDSAVASLGTSLTPEQARLITRYTKQVVIAYDNDPAGQKASQRAIGILDQLDLKVKVLQMEGAKDPDEFIQARGDEAFRQLIEGSADGMAFQLGAAARNYNLSLDAEKAAYLRDAAAILAKEPSPVTREVYASRLAEQTGVTKSVVVEEIDRARRRIAYGKQKQAAREAVRDLRASVQPPERSLRYENEASAVAEEGVVRLLYLDPSLFDAPERRIGPEEFSSPLLARFYTVLREKADANANVSLAALSGEFTPDELSLFTAIIQKPEVLANGRAALTDYIKKIRTEGLRRGAQNDLTALIEQKRNNL